MAVPTFLNLPDRESKPRPKGVTAVIDSGLTLGGFRDFLESAHPYVDFVKFGWGTAVVTPTLDEKIAILRQHGIEFWFGGTLFEIAYAQGKLDEMVAWAKDLGVSHFEVSDGTIQMKTVEKARLIERLSADFLVLSEVGSKDAAEVMSPSQWIRQIRAELDAGAWRVIAEGRESGTAGIYRDTGDVRLGLIQELEEGGIDFDKMFFETPQKVQQVWFLSHLGPNVNMANIAPRDVIGLETLRLGLRSDTVKFSLPKIRD
ncbi:phosphosulfolactate synthase [Oceanibacterium hippocampi]|uniref:Phosphosulfolactate synthase n=1 Tax=Oceanibacterium hippocampi TaxID=745714 RepID=A0A1Y5RQ09_9PROT|nr:phosphosulfolactate synthase [Oceanibacterium hippocampi]SLN22737.1 Phosphosulfolactate synthase [Oceanibacterium hippocampi]